MFAKTLFATNDKFLLWKIPSLKPFFGILYVLNDGATSGVVASNANLAILGGLSYGRFSRRERHGRLSSSRLK